MKKIAYIILLPVLSLGLFGLASIPKADADTASGLIGYWKFDEGSGDSVSDFSGFGHSGTLINGPTWVTSKMGQALSFDGVDDYVDISGFASTNKTYSFSFWIKDNIAALRGDLIIFLDSEAGRFMLYYTGNGTNNIGYYDGNWHDFSNPPNDHMWHHIAFVLSNSTSSGSYYLDGNLQGGASYIGINIGGSTHIGARYVSTDYLFKGALDEFRIYNRILSASDIQELYAQAPKDATKTIPAASCSYEDVSYAVSLAANGDTVTVPAGTCPWGSTLSITRGIYLIGKGAGSTIIKNSTSGNHLITYNPLDYARNEPIRISGFTFDLDNKGPGIALGVSAKTAPFPIQTKARIDHNRFYNAPNGKYQAISNSGTVRGVVDNNIFDSIAYPTRADAGARNSWWDNFGVIQYGVADDNVYFEDNTFTNVTWGIISDCQYSGRYIFRYNTIEIPPDPHGSYPLFDMHGSGGSDMYSCFGGEIYGNTVTEGLYGATLLDQRGGKALVFNNYLQANDGAFIQVREEYADSSSPTTSGNIQHVNDSYYWGNWVLRDSLLRVTAYIGQDCCHCEPACVTGTVPDPACCYNGADGIKEDIDFFQAKDSFNGTSGIGCGRLSSRPSTCTTGVGYWATNQSCSDLTGMVGANPATPISGTLYKCTAPNTWTAYYTPYTYPHPLRVGADTTPPAAPSGLTVK